MIAHSINIAKNLNQIDSIYVSTDSNDIADIASDYGAKIIKRPAELSTDELIGGYDEKKGKKFKIEGYLEEFALAKNEAEDLIMNARNLVYK